MSLSVPAPAPLHFDRQNLTDETLLSLYRALLLPRMIEEKMLVLLRQNKISKWFSGIGQEAVAVGTTLALPPEDYLFPLHRNLGVFTSRGIPFKKLFAQWQGKPDGFTKGRDRSFHFGTPEHRIIGMISHLGAMLGVADGVALAGKLSGGDGPPTHIALAFSGDGGASEGDFHEALNTAAVWDLPVIFVVENNGYGLSTPSSEQFRCKQFIDKAIGYGIEGVQVKGNNVIDVFTTTYHLANSLRERPRPVLLECMTFRMRGHEEASGTKYVPKELLETWAALDPVNNYQQYLLEQNVLTEETVSATRAEFKAYIQAGIDAVSQLPNVAPDVKTELADVYAKPPEVHRVPNLATVKPLRYVDAIKEGLEQALARDEKVILMGQDVAEYGGVFKVTEGFVERFGKARVRNTPLCESAILGAGFGLSLEGYKAIVEMQFADFVSCGFNQIVNNLAKTHYRWGVAPNVTVRLPTGAGVAAGPFHSQSNEAWFFKVPGLKIVYPSTAFDAKGLITSAIEDPNPVLFFEHKLLYRTQTDQVPADYYNLPIGSGKTVAYGEQATVVTYGMGVHWALEAAQAYPENTFDIIDLRSLLPWDEQRVFESVHKTGKCLVLHEDTLTLGIGAEIAARINEELFQQLDAPVVRVGALDTPVPFHKDLEAQFLPPTRLAEKLAWLLAY